MSDVKKAGRALGRAAMLKDPVENLKEGTGLNAAAKGIEKPVRTGATSARKEAAKNTQNLLRKEKVRSAEAEDEIARRKALAGSKSAGRSSLIKSAPSGLATTLGGT